MNSIRCLPLKNKIKILVILIVALITVLSIHGFSSKEIAFYPEKIKIALRAAGNALLLKNNDTTSLVLPVKEVSDQTYELSFQKEIAIHPEILVDVIDAALKKKNISKDYITELINCKTQEVSYSYEILGPLHENEIHCLDRKLPESCYTIKVIMLNGGTISLYSTMGNMFTLYSSIFLIILIIGTIIYRNKSQENIPEVISNHIVLGTLLFYPNQQKLSNDQREIALTAKESELLSIFAQHPNQIVKREQLIKQVWEDNGVIVSRSLDMFISKLRKKLGKESGVKIVNVHGVGYRIEITNN